MAETIQTFKGFVKDSAGNVLLPFTRGELVLAADGTIAFHNSDFEAKPIIKNSAGEVLDNGRYGVVSPEDLFNLRDALVRLVAVETAIGTTPGSDENLSNRLDALITKVGDSETYDKDGKLLTNATGIYAYVIDKIAAYLQEQNALKYKGTVGTGGEISVLPTSNVTNGDIYKVVSDLTYKPDSSKETTSSAKSGDILIALVGASAIKWTLIPAGDETETFIQVGQNVYSGTIKFEGSGRVSVAASTTGGVTTITISGDSDSESALDGRLDALEQTVNGKPAQGTQGLEDYVAPVPGLVDRTSALETDNEATKAKINDRIKTEQEIVATLTVKVDGQDVTVLTHGDDLVTGSAVYQITNTIVTAMLSAETIALGTELSAAQKAYVTGTIK